LTAHAATLASRSGWLKPGSPDPCGARLALLLAFLADHPEIEGCFFDFASLPQKPRSAAEDAMMGRGLSVMGSLCERACRPAASPLPVPPPRLYPARTAAADASAIGTTVLRIKEIPPRPAELDGCVHVGGLAAGWDEAALAAAFAGVGRVEAVERAGEGEAVLRFGSRAEAEAAVAGREAALRGLGEGAWADYEYNERPYEAGKGRGWCHFESGVSTEVTSRAAFMPELAPVLQRLTPKARRPPPPLRPPRG